MELLKAVVMHISLRRWTEIMGHSRMTTLLLQRTSMLSGRTRTGQVDRPALYHSHSVSVCLIVAVVGYFADTNTTFWVFINTTSAPVNAAVGEASNGYRSFSAYQDDGRLLYRQEESEFFGIYYCQ